MNQLDPRSIKRLRTTGTSVSSPSQIPSRSPVRLQLEVRAPRPSPAGTVLSARPAPSATHSLIRLPSYLSRELIQLHPGTPVQSSTPFFRREPSSPEVLAPPAGLFPDDLYFYRPHPTSRSPAGWFSIFTRLALVCSAGPRRSLILLSVTSAFTAVDDCFGCCLSPAGLPPKEDRL